jgi:hypothetical protein
VDFFYFCSMTLEEFKTSLSGAHPPPGISALLKALWYDGKGDWEMSHTIAQDIHTSEGSWIHAYLHRKEGDTGNAAYWYHRAGKPMPGSTLEKEWEDITRDLLRGR